MLLILESPFRIYIVHRMGGAVGREIYNGPTNYVQNSHSRLQLKARDKSLVVL
jgi:hypothetical protein